MEELEGNPRQTLELHNLLLSASGDVVGSLMTSNRGKLREDKLVFWASLSLGLKVSTYFEKLRFLGTLAPFLHPNRH